VDGQNASIFLMQIFMQLQTDHVHLSQRMYAVAVPIVSTKEHQIMLKKEMVDPAVSHTIKSLRFSVGFCRISRLGSASIFLQWFNLAHICIQVSSFHR